MAERKTLIVVGAGASQEANLPTGEGLKQRIASILDFQWEDDLRLLSGVRRISGDHLVYQAIELELQNANPPSRDVNPYLDASRRIRDAMPLATSIDNFIDDHQGDVEVELCGKLAIVRSILDAEKRSLLHFDSEESNPRLKFQPLEESWFNRFFRLLKENCRRGDIQKRMGSVALIVFNYDRCIEHFLFHSLRTYYDVDEREAAELVQGMEIYHPYGKVGCLPWQSANDCVGFGAEPKASQLLRLCKGIKTFTEGTNPDSSEILAIRQRILESEVVLFLGFAFHPLNLALLTPGNRSDRGPVKRSYFATAKGISNSDCDLIKMKLSDFAGVERQNIHLRNDLACSQLFHEYWRSLSLI